MTTTIETYGNFGGTLIDPAKMEARVNEEIAKLKISDKPTNTDSQS
jgi:hypothetical protein